jgi:hypothetical protein
LSEEDVARNLRQSIEILRGFSESWRALERPEEAASVPHTFRGLFRPLAEQELNATLEWLHQGAWAGDGGAPPEPEPPVDPLAAFMPGSGEEG